MAYSEEEGFLKRLVEDLQERVRLLKSFDAFDSINSHCDNLEADISIAIQSAHEHLNKVQDVLLTKVRDYRTERLKSATLFEHDDGIKQEMEELTTDVLEFGEDVLSQPRPRRSKRKRTESSTSESALERVKQEASSLIQNIKSIQARVKDAAFGKKFMKLKKNELFFLESEQVGTLEIYDNEAGQMHIETKISFEEVETVAVEKKQDIQMTLFLSKGNLAYISYTNVAVWNLKAKKIVHSFDLKFKMRTLTMLTNGFLACAGVRGKIYVLDIVDGRLVKEVPAHNENAITSLNVLRNGNLVSCCPYENKLKIWKVDWNCEFTLLLTINTDKNLDRSCQMLSNGFLITENFDEYFRIWNPNDGRLVKEISSEYKYMHFCVLSNDQIVWGCECGIMTYTFDEDEPRFLFKRKMTVTKLAELPNGLLIASICTAEMTSAILIIDPRTGNLLNTLPGHGRHITSISFSKDQQHMITTSCNNTLKIWALGQTTNDYEHVQ